MKKNYKVWPAGKLPEEWQRPELGLIKEAGYDWKDPRDAVTIFEQKVAKFAGSKYAIAVDSCTDAVMLCLNYLMDTDRLEKGSELLFPARSYVSIPMVAMANGFKVKFEDREWSGVYNIEPTPIYDGATRFTKDMYIQGCYQCISFQIKKRLPIGKGGMILTNDADSVKYFRMASFEGRDLTVDQWSDNYTVKGWNMYMTPDDAARGILIFDALMEQSEVWEDTQDSTTYEDLRKQKIFK
jgi:dTDP-4-amino-4,6-dideoxygalactose transaminase